MRTKVFTAVCAGHHASTTPASNDSSLLLAQTVPSAHRVFARSRRVTCFVQGMPHDQLAQVWKRVGKLLTFRGRRPTRTLARFHSTHASELQVGSLDGAAGKSTNCQILTTTTGGHPPLLAGTRSCREATLYRFPAKVGCHNDCSSIQDGPSCSHGTCVSPHARDRCSTAASICRPRQPTKLDVQRRPRSTIHSSLLQVALDKSTWCGTAGNPGQIVEGDYYERAVRITLWVRVNNHVLSTGRRDLIWRLAHRWISFDDACHRGWIIDDRCI